MSDRFAAIASQLGGISCLVLGWKPHDFWQATPAELATALTDPRSSDVAHGPSRDEISRMMERDPDG